MSLKQLSGETLVYGLSSILGRLLNFALVTPFITRVLTEEEVGETGNLMFWTALLIALLVFRMDTAVFRFASRGDYAPAAVFKRTQRVVLILVGAVIGPLLLLSPRIAELLEAPAATTYVQLVLLTVAFDVLSAVPLARLRLQQRAWFFVGVNLGNVAVNILLLYGLLYVLPRTFPEYFVESFRVGYYLLAIAAAAAMRYLALVIDGVRGSSTEHQLLDRKEPALGAPSFRRLLRYSLPLTAVSVAGIANGLVGPSTLLRYDAAAAGYFTAALRMAVFLNLFVTAYQYAAEPFFFRQSSRDLATANRTIYADAMRAYGLVGAVACAGILLALPWLQYFVGPDVRAGFVVLPILLAANFVFGIYSNLSIAYKLTDQTFLGGGIALVGSVFAVGGPLLFTAAYGIYAPAWGMLACFLVMTGLAYLVSRRHFPVDYPFGRIALYAVLAAAAVWAGEFSAHMAYRALILLLFLLTLFLLERRWLLHTFRGAGPQVKANQ